MDSVSEPGVCESIERWDKLRWELWLARCFGIGWLGDGSIGKWCHRCARAKIAARSSAASGTVLPMAFALAREAMPNMSKQTKATRTTMTISNKNLKAIRKAHFHSGYIFTAKGADAALESIGHLHGWVHKLDCGLNPLRCVPSPRSTHEARRLTKYLSNLTCFNFPAWRSMSRAMMTVPARSLGHMHPPHKHSSWVSWLTMAANMAGRRTDNTARWWCLILQSIFMTCLRTHFDVGES